MADPYVGAFPPAGSYMAGAPVVPDDGFDLPTMARALWIGVGGTLKVTLRNSATPITITVTASTDTPLELYAKRVWATGTTASSIVALW